MREEIIISGFGGQGVILAGTLLCYAGMKDDKHVTFFPSYGAEIRGGTANCQVIVSSDSIGNPVVYEPSILVSFNQPSYKRFSNKVAPDGLILINSSLFQPEEKKDNPNILQIPANNIAEDCGSVLAANMVMLGALLKASAIVPVDTLTELVPEVFPSKKKYWEINKKAVAAGYNYEV